PTVNAAGIVDNTVAKNIVYGCANDPNMTELEEIGRFSDAEDDISGTDMNNLDTYFQVSPAPTTRLHKDHPNEQIIRDLNSAPQTRRMTRNFEEHGFLNTTLEQRRNHKDIQNCLKSFYNSSYKKFGPWWSYLMKKELLGLNGFSGTRRMKEALIEAIRLFLAYASFKDFVVYQMDFKSAFIYGKIEEEVYVCQPPGFEDPDFPDRVCKVEKILYGLHQALRAWYETLSTYLLDNGFQRGKIDKTLFIKRDKSDIMLVQVYVDDIIFGSTRKKMCTEFEKMMHKKFQMSSMGELTFFLVNPKVSHLHDVKKIFRYLKGQPKLGLWYPKDSPFDLVAYIDSDYAGASLDRKSTIGAEYIAASNCCGQSTIYIVKNPVFHSKTKHIEIRHHFIRDSNEKKLIQMIKIHTDQNVADLLTKAFDVSRFQYLIASIGMLNL
ncbi:putative ribonuclease H-like domain-containing protein, partial [Tanacetum coccineum]